MTNIELNRLNRGNIYAGKKPNRKTYVVCMWHSLWKLFPHQGGIANRYVLAHSDDVVAIELHPKMHFSRWPRMMATSSVTSANDRAKLGLGWRVIYEHIVVRWSRSFDKWVQSLLYMYICMCMCWGTLFYFTRIIYYILMHWTLLTI